jgi:hypothetical protein
VLPVLEPVPVLPSCGPSEFLLPAHRVVKAQRIQQQRVQRISLQIRNEAMVDVSAMATDVSAAPEKAVQDSGDHSCNTKSPNWGRSTTRRR